MNKYHGANVNKKRLPKLIDSLYKYRKSFSPFLIKRFRLGIAFACVCMENYKSIKKLQVS